MVQVLAILGGDDHIRRTTGLTYAEYARSGFFQLLAVSVLTLVVLGLTRYGVGTGLRLRRSVVAGSEAVVFLTLGIVTVAFRRMSLYENAYGFTMRRLLPHIVIVVLGMVFVLLAVAYGNDLRLSLRDPGTSSELTHPTARTWVIPTALATVVVALLGVNLINPEAIVARSQLERSLAGEDSARAEILGLGSDAVPTVLSWLKDHPTSQATDGSSLRDAIQRWACPDPQPSGSGSSRSDETSGARGEASSTWAEFTLSQRNATRARRVCGLTS